MNCEYLLDTNVYIQTWLLQYPEPVFPGFWEWFQASHQSGRIRTVDKVIQELSHSSTIYAWVKNNAIPVVTSDKATNDAYIQVITAAQNRRFSNNSSYTQNAIEEFEEAADSFLIASAFVHNATLVTCELPGNKKTGRVKIPDISRLLNVNTFNITELLLKLSPRFTWDKTAEHE